MHNQNGMCAFEWFISPHSPHHNLPAACIPSTSFVTKKERVTTFAGAIPPPLFFVAPAPLSRRTKNET